MGTALADLFLKGSRIEEDQEIALLDELALGCQRDDLGLVALDAGRVAGCARRLQGAGLDNTNHELTHPGGHHRYRSGGSAAPRRERSRQERDDADGSECRKRSPFSAPPRLRVPAGFRRGLRIEQAQLLIRRPTTFLLRSTHRMKSVTTSSAPVARRSSTSAT